MNKNIQSLCERAVEPQCGSFNDWGSSMHRFRNSIVKEFCSLWDFHGHCAFLDVLFLLGFLLPVGFQWLLGAHIPVHGCALYGYGGHGRFQADSLLPGI